MTLVITPSDTGCRLPLPLPQSRDTLLPQQATHVSVMRQAVREHSRRLSGDAASQTDERLQLARQALLCVAVWAPPSFMLLVYAPLCWHGFFIADGST